MFTIVLFTMTESARNKKKFIKWINRLGNCPGSKFLFSMHKTLEMVETHRHTGTCPRDTSTATYSTLLLDQQLAQIAHKEMTMAAAHL